MKYFWWRAYYRVEDFVNHWLINFPYRVWTYRKWLAHDYDFDWSPMANIMEIKLQRMAKVFDNGHLMRSDVSARECRVAAHILHRLSEDEYSFKQLKDGVARDECKMLGKLIGRKMRHWWD